MKYMLVKEDKGSLVAARASLFDDPGQVRLIDHPVRIRMLKLIAKDAMYPAEIAKALKLHEQKVYYHLKQLDNAGLVEVVEKRDVRGTTAKKYRSKDLCFALNLSDEWQPYSDEKKAKTDTKLSNFLTPFIEHGKLNARFVVGSPDPHGPHKASARDGHYAVDLAVFFGGMGELPAEFSTSLDVDVHLMNTDSNLIVVGGPVTNMVSSEINSLIPVNFSDERPYGLYSQKTGKSYTADNTGVIARIPNPHRPDKFILYLAGIRGVGTKSAVLALSRHHGALLQTYGDQKVWASVVQGFDLDGDGKIDNIEIVE